MRREESIAIFFTVLVFATCVHCLGNDNFSVKLRELADNVLGIAEFQVHLTRTKAYN